MKQLSDMVRRQLSLEGQIEATEETLKALNESYRALTEVDIPQRMSELGVSSCTTDDGITVKVQDNIVASITKAKEDECFKWLRDNGYGSIVKEVTKTSVHHMTLKAFVKEQLEVGREFPVELFNVVQLKKSVIKEK